MMGMSQKTCKKCGGTGWLIWTVCDGGRCWSCNGLADTGNAQLPQLTDVQAADRWAAHTAKINAARRARRSERQPS
jgi:ferredoxin